LTKLKRNARPHQAAPSNLAIASSEPRANDGGFSYPLGQNAQITDAKYFCASLPCPGYSFRASERPHPPETCGNIVNTADSARKVEEPKAEEPEMIEREPTEPHNDVPDLVALATTGFSADLVASTLGESSVSTEDMPPIDPTVAYEDAPLADDAPAAHGESLPDAGLDLVDADAAPKRPEIGSFWRGNVVFYEVTAVTELMVGLAMYEDRGRWTDILYSLENFDGKFNSVAEPPDWVLNLKTARFAAQRGTTIENPAAGGDNGNAATDAHDELPRRPLEGMVSRLVTDTTDREHYLVASSTAPGSRIPAVGTCWAEPRDGAPLHAYDVRGVNTSEGFALCDFHRDGEMNESLVHLAHFVNGDLAPYLTRPKFVDNSRRSDTPFSFVAPMLQSPQLRGLRAFPALYMHVPELETWWLEDLGSPNFIAAYRVVKVNETVEMRNGRTNDVTVVAYYHDGTRLNAVLNFSRFLDGSLTYLASPEQLPPWVHPNKPSKRDDPEADPLEAFVEVCDGIANELGAPPAQVLRLVDGALASFLSLLVFKELAATSPVVAGFLARMREPKAATYLSGVLDFFTEDLRTKLSADVDKIVEYVNTKVEPRLEKIETRFGTGDSTEALPLEQLEQMRVALAELTERVLSAETELNNSEIQLKQRMDDLESGELEDSRLRETHTAPPKPKSALPARDNEKRRRRDRARREREAKARRGVLGAAAEGSPYADDQPKPGRGRPKGTTLTTGARRPRRKGKRGPYAPRAAKAAPKGAVRGAIDLPKGKPPKKKARPIAAKATKTTKSRFGSLMNGENNPKIVALLDRIPPSQLEKFVSQAKKGIPAMNLTPWSSKEQGDFAKWYFSRG